MSGLLELTGFEVPGAESGIKVLVLDKPGPGGACHDYFVMMPGGEEVIDAADGSIEQILIQGGPGSMHIHFQEGSVKEAGVNGLTHEVLLAILQHRLRSFQAGPFPHESNKLAINACEEAMAVLHVRTQQRILRGVEGQTKA